MSPTLDAFLRSWPFDPWLAATLSISAAIYLRGWLLLHRRDRRALARRPAGCIPRRAGGDLPGPGVADRAVRRRCCCKFTCCSTCC